MSTRITYKLENSEVVEVHTNPGAAPRFFINGVLQTEYTSKWELWFAWHPVQTTGGHWIWGKKIYRRYVLEYLRFDESMGQLISNKKYQYATDFDLLK